MNDSTVVELFSSRRSWPCLLEICAGSLRQSYHSQNREGELEEDNSRRGSE